MRIPRWAIPYITAFYYKQGLGFKSLNRFDEALASLDNALSLQPDHVKALVERGSALHWLRLYEEALRSCRRAVDLSPGYAPAWHCLGSISLNTEKIEEAEQIFLKALEVDKNHVESLCGLAHIRKYDSVDHPDVEHLKSFIDNPAISPYSQDGIYFSLGKIYDECGLYDEAFAYYQQANTLRNARVSYNPQTVTQSFDQLITIFTREFLARPWLPDNLSSPVFMVGMPRSGTTLLAQALSNHPSVFSAGELITVQQLMSCPPIIGPDLIS